MGHYLVTGSSTGIGEACVRRLDDLGHHVYAGVRREADGDRLRRSGSARLTPLPCDITDEAAVAAVAARIADEAGRLDGVVNNAGVAVGGPIEFLPLDDWRRQFEINVFGQLAVTRAVLPLIRAGRGRVVFIGSTSGRVATPLLGPYCASKFAIEGIGETLRHELHPWGIAVSVVEPGAVRTAIWDKGRGEVARLEVELPAEARRLYARHIAAVRKGIEDQERQGVGPEKVADAVQHALLARRPRTRYAVGTDARIQFALVRLLPDRPREAIIRRFAGP